jgi:drug/metabolite transporter (DMT)-like permease
VVGFPLLSAMALRHMSASRGLLFTGLLPLATAIFGVVRGGERPRKFFWAFALTGAALVGGFALSSGAGGTVRGDLLMAAAVTVCGLGYAEGASLSRRLGGWEVICWALLLMAPAMFLVGLYAMPVTLAGIGLGAWAGLAYVSLFSMLIGFMFWYRGLALGGTASIGQLQLLQPMIGFGLAAFLLHESIGWPLLAVTAGVLLCVFGARRFA